MLQRLRDLCREGVNSKKEFYNTISTSVPSGPLVTSLGVPLRSKAEHITAFSLSATLPIIEILPCPDLSSYNLLSFSDSGAMAGQNAGVQSPGATRGPRPSRKMTLFLHLFVVALMFSLVPSVEAIKWVSRKDWGAIKVPPGSLSPSGKEKGVKIHYTGGTMPAIEHSQCDDKMRGFQKQHMNDKKEGWTDIAYNLAVCQHGYVFEGRGAEHMSGANGKGRNTDHYAVLAFVGNKGYVTPLDDMIDGLRDAIAYLRKKGAGNEILGHRDGYDTDCPGDALEKLVKNGSLDPSKAKKKPKGKDTDKDELKKDGKNKGKDKDKGKNTDKGEFKNVKDNGNSTKGDGKKKKKCNKKGKTVWA